jgi:energy-coupling factor transport system permease protein
MISDITLGQFFPGNSVIHKLDPRTKIILATLFIVAVFSANNPVAFATLLLVTLILVCISRISLKVIFKSIKPIVAILIFTAVINVFMTAGEGEPLLSWWIIKIYPEGIARAVLMVVRVVVLIVGTSVLLTYTTSPISLTDGIEALLSPMKKIGLPVHTFAMMMSIALRFIPTLIEETEKIMNAQKSRGADFTSGSLIQRAKALIPILIPLFVSSFKRAEELATAMECRCYRGDVNRTKLVKLQYRASDFVWLLGFVVLIGAVIFSRVWLGDIWSGSTVADILLYKI